MHPDEIAVAPATVRALLAGQASRWAGLDPHRVEQAGTDFHLFRLGTDIVVRLPRHPAADAQMARDALLLPRLGPLVPLETPEFLFLGQPGADFPFRWSIQRWIEGEDALRHPEPIACGGELARFIAALREVDPVLAGPPHGNRGVPLAERDAELRSALEQISELPRDSVLDLWERALRAAPPERLAVVHADLHPGNLLVRDGRLTAVIDWGLVTQGDPAVDLMCAWAVLDRGDRAAFRAILAPDEDEWLRGMGWALAFALPIIPYYRESDPAFAALARRTVERLLAV
ncbi:aminoglycoside phosphotransferase family protein [Histidinibacterium aquaticum]|uniref:Aminoglycoside phosphotransferase family protein n=1 Tax=Histidinibacterium aquaticum TaxID=2613962 RepID=A0A5J5GDX9_9RHOB|nr:aminoglycoside phosphotransferase family protein [Histidinibacterium aquaticum]